MLKKTVIKWIFSQKFRIIHSIYYHFSQKNLFFIFRVFFKIFMLKYKISLLVTAVDSEIFAAISKFSQFASENIEIVFAHQVSDERFLQNFSEKNMLYLPKIGEKWLSKNRNHAILACHGEIAWICDADLEIFPDFFEKIISAYSNCDADIITFDTINEKNKKIYRISEWEYGIRKIINMCSWGVTFRREKIIAKNIFFDEKFGLWADYPIAEENIFLADAYKNNLKIYHKNEIISRHFGGGSGEKYSDKIIIARVQSYRRMFGFFFAMICIFSLCKAHYHLYRPKYTIFQFFYKNFLALLK